MIQFIPRAVHLSGGLPWDTFRALGLEAFPCPCRIQCTLPSVSGEAFELILIDVDWIANPRMAIADGRVSYLYI